MIIHVYTMAHNEELLLPYFIRHYSRLASKVFVADNESTDRTREIAQSMGVELLHVWNEGGFSEDVLRSFKNNAYKMSRSVADWVVVCDVDEFLWHPNLLGQLGELQKRGVTLPQVQGYNMVSDAPPKLEGSILDELKSGYLDKNYSKRIVFDPKIDINYEYGAHDAYPRGVVVEDEQADLKLLHYLYLGHDYFVRKYQHRMSRVSEKDRKRWPYWENLRDIEQAYEVGTSPQKVRVIP